MAVSAQFILIDFIREMSDHNKNFIHKLIEFRLFFSNSFFLRRGKTGIEKKNEKPEAKYSNNKCGAVKLLIVIISNRLDFMAKYTNLTIFFLLLLFNGK